MAERRREIRCRRVGLSAAACWAWWLPAPLLPWLLGPAACAAPPFINTTIILLLLMPTLRRLLHLVMPRSRGRLLLAAALLVPSEPVLLIMSSFIGLRERRGVLGLVQ